MLPTISGAYIFCINNCKVQGSKVGKKESNKVKRQSKNKVKLPVNKY